MSEGAIACKAIFSRAATLADGGWRVSFDISEQDAGKVAKMTDFRGSVLFLTVIPEDEMTDVIPEGNA